MFRTATGSPGPLLLLPIPLFLFAALAAGELLFVSLSMQRSAGLMDLIVVALVGLAGLFASVGSAVAAFKILGWMAVPVPRTTGRCGQCGYAIQQTTGATTPRCPECGLALGAPMRLSFGRTSLYVLATVIHLISAFALAVAGVFTVAMLVLALVG